MTFSTTGRHDRQGTCKPSGDFYAWIPQDPWGRTPEQVEKDDKHLASLLGPQLAKYSKLIITQE